MTKVLVINQAGEKVSDLDLNSKIFGVEKINQHLLHTAVVTQLANARAAIAHTKNRGEVRGSGKKPWKQKGTGRARAGSVRSPLWRHGGVTFGPTKNRNFSLKFNRSAFRSALFMSLTDKARDGKLVVVENIPELNKTAQLVKFLKDISSKTGLGKKTAIIVEKPTPVINRAARNLPKVRILSANSLNVIDLLMHDLIVAKEALCVIEKTYLKK
jgi:large subunit ribosomal protein L4